MFWFFVVYLHLASTGEQEYRVAFRNNSQTTAGCDCTYDNKVVNTTQNATCDPQQFKNLSCFVDCPGVVCQFVKYTKGDEYIIYSICNLFGLYWYVDISQKI